MAGHEHRPASQERQPDRHRPVHGVVMNAPDPVIVFLTVCTKDRSPWLADAGVHNLLREVWLRATAWLVGRYVLMPDHFHLFAAPGEPELSLERWVTYWKSQFTKRHRVSAHRWHVDHWDRRLRRSDSYDSKWDYVVNNPVRHGLVDRPELWPFQGELFELRW